MRYIYFQLDIICFIKTDGADGYEMPAFFSFYIRFYLFVFLEAWGYFGVLLLFFF